MGALIHTFELYRGTAGAIAKNNAITSDVIELAKMRIDGYFSLHMIHIGGTITASVFVCSTATGTFVEPDTNIDIFTAAVAGTHFASFTPPLAPFMKIKFIETNTAACTSLSVWLNVH